MQRLSGLDASFLYLETPAQLLHVCGVIILDPETVPSGYSFTEFKDELERRIDGVPMFHRKLKQVPLGIDHPVWVDDEDFDVDRHVHRMALPAPGGERELADLCGHLAGIPLDRSRPLWEFVVIEGYRTESGAERIVVFTKMHHCTVDGVSGANAISFMCSLEADAPPLETPPGGAPPRAPGDAELLARGVATNLYKPVALAKVVGPTVKGVASTIGRAREGTAMPAPLTAPRTSFNATITGHRSLAIGDMSLQKIKDVKNAVEGATVNDVVIAVSGGALRRYLTDRDELPETSLIASVPVSVRGSSKKKTGSNKVSTIFSRLGTDIEDPLERLQRGLADQPERQGPPQGDLRRLAPGLGPVRGPAHLRPGRADGLVAEARRLRSGDPQPGHLQRPRPTGAALLHGRPDRGPLPPRTGLPRRRPQRHGDVERRQDPRRRDRLS